MSYEHGVEEWLPGGIGARDSAAAEVDGTDFTLDRGSSNGAGRHGNGTATPTLARPERQQTTVDLNAIDFEELLALGISIAQAARFISQRERRRGIKTIAEIDGFYGLAPSVRDILRRSGHV